MDRVMGEKLIGGGQDGEDQEFSPVCVDFQSSFRHAMEVSAECLGYDSFHSAKEIGDGDKIVGYSHTGGLRADVGFVRADT